MRLPLNYWLETIADDTIREAAINEYSNDKIQVESLSSAILHFNKWGDLWEKYRIDFSEAYAMSLNSNLKQRPYTSPEGHTFNPDTGEWTMPAADHLPIMEDKTAEVRVHDKTEVIEVTKCADCPFYEYQDEMMDSSCRADETVNMKPKFHDVVARQTIHESCPLKSKKITVKLK